MFTSSEPAVVQVSWPAKQVSNVAGGEITVFYSTNPAAVQANVVDGSGLIIDSFYLNVLPGNVSLGDDTDFSTSILFAAAYLAGKTVGAWSVELFDIAGPHFWKQSLATFQWGGTVDLLAAGAADATISRKVATNKYAPNSSTVPTELTLYDDDNTTPLAARTIANADGSAVSPAQVLSLGKLT